jgi:hypothetical protein
MSTIIRLRSGTLEFRRTDYGSIVIVNGRHRLSRTDFLVELVDAYYRLGLSHPRGTAAWLEEMTGIDLHAGCPLCDGPGEITQCPQCSVGRCPKCAATHDDSGLCRATRECADVHRQMREATEFNDSDFYFARKAMAASFIRRSQH